MSESPERVPGRRTRFFLLGLGIALVGLLALSFAMSGSGLDETEAEAQARAERYVEAFVIAEVTPEIASKDILGSAYRELLIGVQAGILSDHRVVRIRIWKAGGDLIFSTAQRDNIEEYVAVDHPQIGRATTGETVSIATEAAVRPQPGLAGSDDRMFQTFVPLRLEDGVGPFPVAEVDQRYSAIQEAATRIWRLVQLFLILALVGFAGVLVITRRSSPRVEPALRHASHEAAPQHVSREAEPPVSRRERRRRRAQQHAASDQSAPAAATGRDRAAQARGPDEATPPAVPAEIRRRLEELDLKLRAEEAEREQVAGENRRLRAALAEKEAELVSARDASTSVHEAERPDRDAELEAARASAEEARSATEEAKAEARRAKEEVAAAAAEVEATAAELARTRKEVERLRLELDRAAVEVERRKAGLEKATQRTDTRRQKRSRASEAASDGGAEADPSTAVAELRARVAEMEAQRRVEVVELQKAQESLANTQFELMEATRKRKAAEERLRTLESGETTAPARPAPGAVASERSPEPTSEPVPPEAIVDLEAAEVGGGAARRPRETPVRHPASASGSRGEHDPGDDDPAADESVADPDDETGGDLSLRARLARAAAARHRGPGPTAS